MSHKADVLVIANEKRVGDLPSFELKRYHHPAIRLLFLEGNGVVRTYITEIVNGIPHWPPEECNVDEADESLRGAYNGLWAAGMAKGMEGVDLN